MPRSGEIEATGGKAPYTFTASNVQLTKGGAATPFASLEDFGLFLNKKNGRLPGIRGRTPIYKTELVGYCIDDARAF